MTENGCGFISLLHLSGSNFCGFLKMLGSCEVLCIFMIIVVYNEKLDTVKHRIKFYTYITSFLIIHPQVIRHIIIPSLTGNFCVCIRSNFILRKKG